MNGTWKASEIGVKLVEQAITNKGWSYEEFVTKVAKQVDSENHEIGFSKSTFRRFRQSENIKVDFFKGICKILELNEDEIREISVPSSSEEGKGTEFVSSNSKNVVQTDIRTFLDSMPVITNFYGRDQELAELKSQIDNNQSVVISGIPGVGKTWVAAKIVDHFIKAPGKFKCLIWRSLKYPPYLKDLICSILEPFVPEQELNEARSSNDGGISQLTKFLNQNHCLIILDNWNDLFKEDELAGCYKEGFKNYGELLKQIATINHSSCIVITTSEEPRELTELQSGLPIYSTILEGLDLKNFQNLFNHICNNSETITNEDEVSDLFKVCKGNPFALTIYAKKRQSLGDGSNPSKVILNDWVKSQYYRLSKIERVIVDCLTLINGVSERECLLNEYQDALNVLKQTFGSPNFTDGLHSLIKRDLIHSREGNKNYFELNYYLCDFVVESWTQAITGIATISIGTFDSNTQTEDFSKLADNQSHKTHDGTRRQIEQIIKDKLTLKEKWEKILELQ